MNSMLLVEDLSPGESHLVAESDEKKKNHWLQGTLMQAEVQNRNGRVYPLAELSQAVESAQRRISESNGIFGELDHPDSLTINLDRISHVVTEMKMDGTNAIGRMKILDTPKGMIAQKLIESGVILGVSSRGAGNVSDAGKVSGFQLVTVDLVANPSAPGATPSPVFESLMRSEHGKKVIPLSEQLKTDPAAQKYFEREIKKYLSENLFAKRR